MAALGAVMLAGLVSGDASARRAKTRLVATVNGKRLKGSRPVIALYSTASFSVNAAAKPKRGIVRTVTANCGPVNIKTVALPITVTGCYGSYTEAPSRHGTFRQWTGTGIEVTVESFDGTRIVGTFQGTLVIPTHAGDPPATVERGSFSIALTDTGV